MTLGDIVFKFWVISTLPRLSVLYMIGMMLYIIGMLFLVESFREKNIAIASTIFILVNIITLSIVSWLVFGEKLSYSQLGFLFLAGISIVCLGEA